MRTEIENKLHLELKENLKKVLVYYKDTVSWNDATTIFEEAVDEMGLELKTPIIPKVIIPEGFDSKRFINQLYFGENKALYDK